MENEFTIADINASEFSAYLKFSMKVGGSVVADVAPSVLHILGLQQPKEMTGQCLIKK